VSCLCPVSTRLPAASRAQRTSPICLAYGRRSTRDSSYQSSHPPRVCLYLPSCRRTHPAPCIRSLLALTRPLCGLPARHRLAAAALPSSPGLRAQARTAVRPLLRRVVADPATLLSALAAAVAAAVAAVAAVAAGCSCRCLSWPLALSSGTCRRIHNDANLNTTTTHLRPMPIVLQHPPVASRHCASLARPSKNPPARRLRASS
jgi:hypothetical protein